MMLKNDRYTYRVTWSPEDEEYVGLCAEFPSLSWLAETPEEALRGIREVVAEVVADLKMNGEPVPEPLAVRHYSGRFMVRIPPEVHRELAINAVEEGVSLNRLVSARLAGVSRQ
jgi:predicted HicB family RNase H-like nuclease